MLVFEFSSTRLGAAALKVSECGKPPSEAER